MNFPGSNKLIFSEDAIKAALAAHVSHILSGARIVDMRIDRYPTTIELEFTSDPLPVLVEVPKASGAA